MPPDDGGPLAVTVAEATRALEERMVGDPLQWMVDVMPPVPATGIAGQEPQDALVALAQAVYGGTSACRVVAVTAVAPSGWRNRYLEVIAALAPPSLWERSADTDPDWIALAERIVDIIEDRLGVLTGGGEIRAIGRHEMLHRGMVNWTDLLLVTGAWATIIHVGLSD